MSGLPESKNKVKNKMRNILSIVFNRNDDADIVTLVVQNLEFKGTVLGNLMEGGALMMSVCLHCPLLLSV